MKRRGAGSITIRLTEESLRTLRERAKAEQTTPSRLVRELVEREVVPNEAESGTAWERTSKHVGAVRTGPVNDGARARELLLKGRRRYTLLP